LAAGEMLELGGSSPDLHRECGRFAASLKKIDWIIGVQGEAAEFVHAAVEAGHPKERAKFFKNSAEAADCLADLIARDDLLLLKGSRGVKMEKILEAIEAGHARMNFQPSAEKIEAESKGQR
jgi:UDP-N-acetylmuramoyl-tripeptide--D-alanyl-D-alanine ligase